MKVSDKVLDTLSDKNDGLDVAAVIDELQALRRVAAAAKQQTENCDCTCADCMAVQRAVDDLKGRR